jgi:hypothetical protein
MFRLFQRPFQHFVFLYISAQNTINAQACIDHLPFKVLSEPYHPTLKISVRCHERIVQEDIKLSFDLQIFTTPCVHACLRCIV